MNINKKIKLIKCTIRFKDNYNYQYLNKDNQCLFEVQDSTYRFHDKSTMIRFMLSLGITCGCERIKINNKIEYCYNKLPMNQGQKEFLANRARALSMITDMTTGVVTKNDCGCKNKKRPK